MSSTLPVPNVFERNFVDRPNFVHGRFCSCVRIYRTKNIGNRGLSFICMPRCGCIDSLGRPIRFWIFVWVMLNRVWYFHFVSMRLMWLLLVPTKMLISKLLFATSLIKWLFSFIIINFVIQLTISFAFHQWMYSPHFLYIRQQENFLIEKL